jgi:hypothetical protein
MPRIGAYHGGKGGLVKVPDEMIAHIRYLAETEHLTTAQIVEKTDNQFTPQYIRSVTSYQTRLNVKAKKWIK